ARRAPARHRRIRGRVAADERRRGPGGRARLEPRRLRFRPARRAQRRQGLHRQSRAVGGGSQSAGAMSRADRLRLWAAWGAPALALGFVVLAVGVTSDHESHAALEAALWLVIGWSFALAGLLALDRRPDNNTGRLLVWTGSSVLVAALGLANDRVLYTLGEASSAVLLAAFVHLVLAYPEGKLHSRAERRVVASGYALAVGANVLTLMFTPHPSCDRC